MTSGDATALPDAGASRVTRFLLSPWIARLALVLSVLIIWGIADVADLVSPLVLPSMSAVAEKTALLITETSTWQQLGITSFEVLVAFILSTAVGLLIGGWSSRRRRTADLVSTLAAWGQLVPLVTVYPVFLLSMGIGPPSKIAYAGVLAVFPVVLATVRALETVDRRLVTVAKSLGASSGAVFWQIELPAARNGILSGVRVGAALSLIGVILGEMLGSSQGIGAAITASGQTFDTDTLYAYILFTLTLTLIFNWVITRGYGGD